jgi:hypothetical protein
MLIPTGPNSLNEPFRFREELKLLSCRSCDDTFILQAKAAEISEQLSQSLIKQDLLGMHNELLE